MISGKKRLYVAVLMASAGLQAQAQSGGNSMVLEEVMVTAQKTVEIVQEVPSSINAITGATFLENVSFDLQDVGRLTPGLSMTATGNQQNITLRGVGTYVKASQSPRTNIYLDGSFVPNQQLAFSSQFDIERFEVLRGPQGTLYGKTSPTGSLVIHTRDPDLQRSEGYLQTSLGEHNLFNTQFGLSIPLIEGEMGLRIAGIYDENNSGDQYYKTLKTDVLARTRGGRATLVWAPEGRFDGRLSHTYVESDSNAAERTGETATMSRYKRQMLDDQARQLNMRINQTVLELNWDMDWAVLTSQSYFGSSAIGELKDQDYTAAAFSRMRTDINLNKLFNTELRLASVGNERWDWIGGLYYASTNSETRVGNGSTRMLPLPTGMPAPAAVWLPASIVANVGLNGSSEDWGAFIHNSFFLTDDWTLTAGARWTDERRVAANSMITSITLPTTAFQSPSPTVTTGTRYIDWTGTLKLSYKLHEDQMVYATYDRGGRSGGQSLDLAGTAPDDLQNFGPESSNSFELGYKSDLMDGRMRFNAAVYHQVYKDFHVQFQGIPIGTASGLNSFDIIVNAKEVLAKGVEIDLTYLFTEHLRSNISIAYNDTKYEDFNNAPCNLGVALGVDQFSVCDYSGQRVGGDTGNWSVITSANYALPIHAIGSEWYLDGLLNFNSFRIAPNSRRQSASYAVIDVFTGLRSLAGTWDVKLWVKNLLDKEATLIDDEFETLRPNTALAGQPVSGQASQFGTGVLPITNLVRPRQIGVTATWNF